MTAAAKAALSDGAARLPAMTFGRRLKQLREGRKLGQRQLSAMLAERGQSAHYTYLSHLETQGERGRGRGEGVRYEPSAALIGHLAAILEADEDELLALAGKPPPDVAALLVGSEGARAFFRAAVAKGLSEEEWAYLIGCMGALP